MTATGPPTPPMSVAEALAYSEPWHGIHPCSDCGIFHSPVWWHVDFDSDHPLAAKLRRERHVQQASIEASIEEALDMAALYEEWLP